MAGFAGDPAGFVAYAFPWGEPGPLADRSGPDGWQQDLLEEVRDGLKTPGEAIRHAVASGHGVGKSALVAWLTLWAMATHADTRGIVTANTESQLRTKTWPELSKWSRMCICRHWFKLTATALHAVQPGHERTWRIDAVSWSEKTTEAFAGLHNAGKRILVVFDEASALPDAVWETMEGALTDEGTEILWFAFGNPTRNSGRFRECFGRFRHRWAARQVDSRTVAITNKEQIASWVADYGEDSDFVRVRVKGEFPRAGTLPGLGDAERGGHHAGGRARGGSRDRAQAGRGVRGRGRGRRRRGGPAASAGRAGGGGELRRLARWPEGRGRRGREGEEQAGRDVGPDA